MHIDCDWKIFLDPHLYLDLQGEGLARAIRKPDVRQELEEAFDQLQRELQPAACWDYFPIEKILHERLVLNGGVRLGGELVTKVVAGAEELIVAICTVGDRPDWLIEQAQRAGQLIKTLFLHDLASWAVELLHQQLCQRLTAEARQVGWRVSAALSPGESNWPVEEQKVIFSLLDASQIGVTLNSSCLMLPIKSLSLVMGRGRYPLGVEEAGSCDFCSISERCSYRSSRKKPSTRS